MDRYWPFLILATLNCQLRDKLRVRWSLGSCEIMGKYHVYTSKCVLWFFKAIPLPEETLW